MVFRNNVAKVRPYIRGTLGNIICISKVAFQENKALIVAIQKWESKQPLFFLLVVS